MYKEEKKKIVSELQERCINAKAVFVADYKGLNVEQITGLRKSLRDIGVDFKVIKNTFAKIAVKNTNVEPLKDFFEGTSSIVMSYTDPVAAAKVITRFAKEEPKFKIRAGVLTGKIISLNEIIALSELPSREVLLGRLLGILNTIPTNLVYVLSGVPRKFVYVLAAIQDKKGN